MSGAKWRSFARNALGRLRAVFRDEDLYYRFFALFLAVILWFFAGGRGRLVATERVISVRAEVVGVPDHLQLISQAPSIRLEIRGPGTLLSRAEQEARAVVDLTDAPAGEGTYPVEASLPRGVELISVTPRWVGLTTAPVVTSRLLQVIPRFAGELPAGLGLRSFTVVPPYVSVNLPADLAGSLEALVTEPIWLTGLAAGEYDLIIGVAAPPRVEIAGSPTVRVKLAVVTAEPPFRPEQMPPQLEPEPEPPPEPGLDEPILPVEPEPNHNNQWIPPPETPDPQQGREENQG